MSSVREEFYLSTKPNRPVLSVVTPGKFETDPAALRKLLLGPYRCSKASSQTTNLPKLEQVMDFKTSQLYEKLKEMILKAKTPQAADSIFAGVNALNNSLLSKSENKFSQICVTNQLVNQTSDVTISREIPIRDLVLNSGSSGSGSSGSSGNSGKKKKKNINNSENWKEKGQNTVSNLFNTAKGYFRLALCMGNYAFYTFYPHEANSFCVLLVPIPSRGNNSSNPLYVLARQNEEYGPNCMNGVCNHGKKGHSRFCPQYWRSFDFMDKNEVVAFVLSQIGGSSVTINGGNYASKLNETLPKHPKFDESFDFKFNRSLNIRDLKSKKHSNVTDSEVQLQDLLLSQNTDNNNNNGNKGRSRNNSKKAQTFMEMFKKYDNKCQDLVGFIEFIRENRESDGLCFQVNIGFNKVYFEPVILYRITIEDQEWMFGYALVLNSNTNEYEVRGILNDYIIRQNNLLLNATCDDSDKLIKCNKQYRAHILIGDSAAERDMDDEKSPICVTIDSSTAVSSSIISNEAPAPAPAPATFDESIQNGVYGIKEISKAQMLANLRKSTNNIGATRINIKSQLNCQDDPIVKKGNNNNGFNIDSIVGGIGQYDVNGLKHLAGIVLNRVNSHKPRKFEDIFTILNAHNNNNNANNSAVRPS